MKKLKKFAVIFMVLLCQNLFGQTFGVRGGFNLSNLLNKDNDYKYSEEYKLNPGFNVGVTMEMPVSGNFMFETGIIVDTKGYKRNYTATNAEHEIVFRAIYIDIPLHFKYEMHLQKFDPYFLAGPYLGVGISGKISNKTIVAGVSSTNSNSINWGNDNNSDLKQIDGGIDFGIGINFSKISVGANFGLGLVNICPLPDNGQIYNNRVMSLFVAYKFSK
jgi:hypothetical protein